MTPRTPPPSSGVTVGLEALTIADAMRAFAESGLIDLLERLQPISSRDLARRAHVSPRAIRLLLDVLAEAGVVHEDASGELWQLNGAASSWAAMIGGSFVAPFLDRGVGAKDVADPARIHAVGREYTAVTSILASIVRPIAEGWTSCLASPGRSMLEVGAGAAPWTKALLTSEPTMCSTLVDLEPVLDAHRVEILESLPDASLRFVGGDVFSANLKARFDLVIISNFCRLFDDRANQRLFKRVGGWLAPSGRVVIADAVASPTGRNRSLAIYELGLAARASSGRVYALEDFNRWLMAAGMAKPEHHPTHHGAVTVLVASKA